MRAHDWTTLFKLEHMLKDIRLCLEEAEAVRVGMELIEDTAKMLAEAEGVASASRTSPRSSRWSRRARTRACSPR